MRAVRSVLVLSFSLWLAACSSVPYSDGYPKTAQWALMPVINHSSEPAAAELTQQALLQVLTQAGMQAQAVPSATAEGSNNLLSSASLLAQAKEWSASQGVPLALSAVVDQWRQTPEAGSELALTLHVLDGLSGERLWTTEGQVTGQPDQSPETLLPQLLPQLLAALPLAP